MWQYPQSNARQCVDKTEKQKKMVDKAVNDHLFQNFIQF